MFLISLFGLIKSASKASRVIGQT